MYHKYDGQLGAFYNGNAYNSIMLWSRRVVTRLFAKPSASLAFSKDTWKERDEAAEKVYISQKEAASLKRLLQKVEQEELEQLHKDEEFERRLREILERHGVGNEAFFCEVSNVHKMMGK